MSVAAVASLYVTALNPTDALTEGFLPAAHRLGLPVVVLTGCPSAHAAAYDGLPHAPRRLVDCAVRDPQAIVDAVHRGGPAAGLLSNSDHLQVPTALAAGLLGLVGKDWRASWWCKDKALARRRLAQTGLDTVFCAVLHPGGPLPGAVPYPAVVKPREGVASEDAYLVQDARELAARVAEIRARRPDLVLVVEEYLDGELYTLETLGDANGIAVVGSWRTTLGAPPSFVEQRLDWAPGVPDATQQAVLAQLAALGVRLGACHTEYVLHQGWPRIIEVNYRLIGDRVDLVLAQLLGVPIFEYVIRLHLGERLDRLPLPDPATVPGHAAVEYVCADRAGRLRRAPGRVDAELDGVRVSSRPLRAVGTVADLRHCNRDYLAAIAAIGPDRARVDAAIKSFRDAQHWVIE